MKRARVPTPSVAVSFFAATIFDMPMIFNLMYEGAVAGSFADIYVKRTGFMKLFGWIFKSLVAQNFQSTRSGRRYEWQVVVGPSGDEVGFLKRSIALASPRNQHLTLLAIHPEYRSKGIGTAVLEEITSKLTQGTELTVHCTKYARAMQHILKRQRFKRNVRFCTPNLEEYASIKE